MKAKNRLDKIMMSCREKMQAEVSALLGKTLNLGELSLNITDKETFFSDISGKFVLAKIQMEGDLAGDGCMLVSVKDAIRIGGTLIMLPESELEIAVTEQDYTEELEDSYGEIANIFCGAMSATFEEQHPKKFRLVRTEQEVIVPAKVDVEDDAPVPPGSYYVATGALSIGDRELGDLHVLLPAEALGLVGEDTPVVQENDQPAQNRTEPQSEVEATPASQPDPEPTQSKVDVTKQQKIIDRLLEESFSQIGDDVGGLLGSELKVVSRQHRLLSKEEILEQAEGKQVMARMDVRGEGEGEVFLFNSLKDAVVLGGTLIMLPESELEEAVRQEEFGEDAQDAYGEITNIIAGVYTAIFEEQSRKKLGFVKTGLETVIPTKVDPDSDDVIGNQDYYLSSGDLHLNGKELGRMQMAFPATLLDLQELAQPEPSPQAIPAADGVGGTSTSQQAHASQTMVSADATTSKAEAAKLQKAVDKLLEISFTQIGDDTGGLLGSELKIIETQHRLLNKEEFLDQVEGKLVMARMDVRGEGEGEAYLFCSLKDAVFLGGSLIMLPESELEEAVRQEEFGEDAQDAYGEVANIIAGVYTGIFEEQSRKKLGFVKTALETVVPIRVDPDNDDVIPNQYYYVSSGEIVMNGKALGRLQTVFPAALLDLEALALAEQIAPVAAEGDTVESSAPQSAAAQGKAVTEAEGIARLHRENEESAEILIYTDHLSEGQSIAASLQEHGFVSKILNYKDPVHAHLSSHIRLVFLVMEQVNEQGFAMAIKINSGGGQVPLVAAGPAWTRTLVLRAVKYGATDILITPAVPDDIQEKLEMNLPRKAA